MARPTKAAPQKIREAGTLCLRFPENCVEMLWFGEVHRPDENGCLWLPPDSVGELLSHGFKVVEENHG